jgi:hypothetical protein
LNVRADFEINPWEGSGWNLVRTDVFNKNYNAAMVGMSQGKQGLTLQLRNAVATETQV